MQTRQPFLQTPFLWAGLVPDYASVIVVVGVGLYHVSPGSDNEQDFTGELREKERQGGHVPCAAWKVIEVFLEEGVAGQRPEEWSGEESSRLTFPRCVQGAGPQAESPGVAC
jgi:hypothetical protein